MKKKTIVLLLVICVLCGAAVTYKLYDRQKALALEEERIKLEEERIKLETQYNECLLRDYNESELSEELRNEILNINSYIDTNYSASVAYEDATTGFSYSYHPDTVYYGASLIKLVEAMYIFDKASEGNINIDDTLTYTYKYKYVYSDGMSLHNYGDEVSLKELISYALMYSDNSAHFMLNDYIGLENLRIYGKSLGAKGVLANTDTFGNQTAYDMNIYLKHAYEIIKNNN